MSGKARFRFGDFELDEANDQLRRAGAPVQIRAMPLRFLACLLHRRDRIVPREELLKVVWPDVTVSDAALASALRDLRRALGDDGTEQRYVKTLRGQGYRFGGSAVVVPTDREASPGYFGRRDVVRRLGALVDGAVSGRGQVLVLSGEPGIGKSRTLEEAERFAAGSGARFVVGWCAEGAGAPPYWPWVQVLRDLTRADGVELLGELEKLLPERAANAPGGVEDDSDAARFRVLDALARFLEASAHARPLVVALEDLHWADPASLAAFEFIANELRRAPILLIATHREAEVHEAHPLSRTLGALARCDWCARIALKGLTREEGRALVQHASARKIGRSVADAWHERTGGNPFYLRELAAAGSDVPDTVLNAIAHRLAALPEDTRAVLEHGAVIGREFEVAVVRRALERTHTDVVERIAPAIRAGFVVETREDVIRFDHDLLRDAIVGSLAGSRRRDLHRRAGESIEAAHADNVAPYAGELARHFAAAGDPRSVQKAIDFAEMAALHALSLTAYEESLDHCERALELLAASEAPRPRRRCELVMRRARVLRLVGRVRDMKAGFEEAIAIARGVSDATLLALAACGFAEAWDITREGQPHTALGPLEEAAGVLDELDTDLRARLLGMLGVVLARVDQLARANRVTEEALSLARESSPETLLRVLDARQWARSGPDGLGERLALTAEMIELVEGNGLSPQGSWAHELHGRALLEIGDIAGAERATHRALAYARARRDRFELPRVEALGGWVALLRGEFEEAERLASALDAEGKRIRSGNLRICAARTLLAVARERGDLARAEPIVHALAARGPSGPTWDSLLGVIHVETGRLDLAQADLESTFARNLAGSPEDWSFAMALLAEVAAALRDQARVAELYARLIPFEDQNVVQAGGNVFTGSFARYLGILAHAAGSPDRALAHLDRAQRMHAEIGARPWLARTRLDRARVFAARGSPSDAREAERECEAARAEAESLRMTRLLAELDAFPDLP